MARFCHQMLQEGILTAKMLKQFHEHMKASRYLFTFGARWPDGSRFARVTLKEEEGGEKLCEKAENYSS